MGTHFNCFGGNKEVHLPNSAPISHCDIRSDVSPSPHAGIVPIPHHDKILPLLEQQPTSHTVRDMNVVGHPGPCETGVHDQQIVFDMLPPTEASGTKSSHSQAFSLPGQQASSVAEPSLLPGISGWRRLVGEFSKKHSVVYQGALWQPVANPYYFHARFERRPGGTTRVGRLSLDTGSDFNILSVAFAELLGLKPDDNFAGPLAYTAGGIVNTLGKTTARWACNDSRFAKRFYETEFYVLPIDVDAIIGGHEIHKLGLLKVNSGRFFGWISKTDKVDRDAALRAQNIFDARRRDASRQRAEDDERRMAYENRRWAYATEKAALSERDYLNQYRQYHGREDDVSQRVGRSIYSEVYERAYQEYPQHHAR